MENYRSGQQKVEKMKELGIFDKWVSNTDKRTMEFENTNPIKQELNCVQRRNRLLANYAYLSDMIGMHHSYFGIVRKGDSFGTT